MILLRSCNLSVLIPTVVMTVTASIFRKGSLQVGATQRRTYCCIRWSHTVCFLPVRATCCSFDMVRDRLHWREQEQESSDSKKGFFLFSPIPSLFKSSRAQRVLRVVLIGVMLADQTEGEGLRDALRVFAPQPCSLVDRGIQRSRQIKTSFMEKKPEKIAHHGSFNYLLFKLFVMSLIYGSEILPA